MKQKAQRTIGCIMLAVMMFTTLAGCTLDAAASGRVTKEEVRSRVARIIDEEMLNILPYLEENEDISFTDEEGLSIDLRSMKGSEIVARATDEGGEKYIDFSYSVLTAQSSDEIVKSAKGLVSDEDYEMLLEKVREEEENAARMYDELSRSLTMAQQKELYKDLKKLVIKAVVLLTAGLVYAAIPKTMIWGKVSAACVVAVAAGVVASGVMTFLEYRKFGIPGDDMPSFESWLQSIYKDSYSAWAIAASMIATGTAAKRSPVVTGLIIAAFSLYGIIDEARPILKKYNFSI
ncbi:MAG: hypothetical protein ACI4NM_06965 [Bullifex sp.]